jgi:hypothetical protein
MPLLDDELPAMRQMLDGTVDHLRDGPLDRRVRRRL